MAQNKDLKTAVQLKREYTKLLKEQTAMESKLLRYQQEGIDLTGEEKREFIDLKRATEEAGKAAAKAADKRTKAGKTAQKASEKYADSLQNKLGKALERTDDATKGIFKASTDAFGGLVDLAEEYSSSSKKGADKATELIDTIVDLQEEVFEAGAGFKNLSDDQAQALNDKIKEIEKSAGDTFKGAFKEGGDRTKDIFEGMKGTASAGKSFSEHASDFADALGISSSLSEALGAAIVFIAAKMADAAEQAQKFQDNLGVTNATALSQIFSRQSLALSILGINDELTEASTQLGLASNNLGLASDKSGQVAVNLAQISKDTGASAATLATVNQLFQNSAGATAEQASQLQLGLASMSEMAGVIPGQVLEDMATNAEMLAKFSDGTAEGMARAAIQAQKLGINLSKAGQIADSLLNLESSIASEFEASVLIGRDLNFDRARNLALNNDIEGAMKDIVDQLGSEEEFNRLNAIQRQALADSIGVGVEDLAAMVRRGGEGAADLDIGIKLQKQANKRLTDILFALTPASLASAFTVGGGVIAGAITATSKTIGKFMEPITGMAGKIAKKIGIDKFLGSGSILGKAMGGVSKLMRPMLGFLSKLSLFLAPLIDMLSFAFGGKDTKENALTSIGFGGIGAGIGAIFGGPVGAAIGYGIGSIVGMLVDTVFPKVGEMLSKGISGLISGFGSVLSGAGDLATGAFNAGMTGLADLKVALTSYFSGLGNAVMNGVNLFKDSAVNVYSSVTSAFSNLGQVVVSGITSVFDALVQQAKDLIASAMDFGGGIMNMLGIGGDEPSGPTSQDFIMRPGQGIKRFSSADTVLGVKDPGVLSALAGNRGMGETGTKQVALLQTLVTNSASQMAEIVKTNKEIVTAVNNIGTSAGG